MTRTITTDATGRREATPELATVDVDAVGEGPTAAAAREAARDRAATVRESLADLVADERLRTVELRVEESSPVFDDDADEPYRATETLAVDCVPETAEAVVVGATDAGATVESVEFRLPEETRRRLQDEALTAAMERARAKADRLAAVEGLSVAGVREVTTMSASVGMESVAEDALFVCSDADFQPDPVSVSQSVEVSYDLTE